MAKPGLPERIYLQYLRTKFKTIAMVSPPVAGKIAFDLFCTPYPKYKKRKAPAIFHAAHPLHLNLENQLLRGHEWVSKKPNGKTVLIVHGYASYSYKFEAYIQPLLLLGFRVICFDAPGHGLSQGKYINALIYKGSIEAIMNNFGPIDHFIGHSLGGLTLSLIAETISNPMDHKFVLIAPATKTTTTFESYFNMMHFSPIIQQAFLDELNKRTHLPIHYFEADRAIENFKGKVLWIHDQEDPICPYNDLIEFKNKAKTNIEFLITNGLGHNKVYKSAKIIDKIMSFLAINE